MAARGGASVATWRDAAPAPVVLVLGPEALLADRAVDTVLRRARDARGDLEVVSVDAARYEKAQLGTWTSPSLFGEPRMVVVDGLEQATDALVADALAYLAEPQEDVVLVLRHAGGQRGRKLLDAVRAMPGAVVVDCPALKDAEKAEFVAGEFRDAGRPVTPAAVRALVEAVGSDLRELAAACAQLVSDIPPLTAEGTAAAIDVGEVDRYHGGRAEVSGFRVADAVVAGQRELALGLLRQAIATGVDPIPVLAVMAMKLRGMVKVGAAGGGRSADLARELGMAPWQVDRARRDLRGWTPDGLAVGLLALAAADTAVKGGGRDPVYAVEKAVITVTGARG